MCFKEEQEDDPDGCGIVFVHKKKRNPQQCGFFVCSLSREAFSAQQTIGNHGGGQHDTHCREVWGDVHGHAGGDQPGCQHHSVVDWLPVGGRVGAWKASFQRHEDDGPAVAWMHL